MSCLEIPIDLLHQLIDGRATMVSGDVCMQVLPQPLDVVLLRAERRQEVQHEALAIVLQRLACLATVMDAVVVQDEMIGIKVVAEFLNVLSFIV